MTTAHELEEGYDSSPTTTHVGSAFGPLFGVTFYDSRPRHAGPDPESYHLKEIPAEKLGWHWWEVKVKS